MKNKKFTIKREEILPILYENFNDFPKEDMWDEKKVVKFLMIITKMNKFVNDKDFRKSLFVKYPVK